MVSEIRMDSPSPASGSSDGTPVSPPPRNARSPAGPDAPVRVEVEMPRNLYDRLTGYDDAPRCRYDMATGRAEFVAEPGIGHERRAAALSGLFTRIEHLLEDAGHPAGFLVTAATRLLSDDGAFEPMQASSSIRRGCSGCWTSRTTSIRARGTRCRTSWPRSIEASARATSSGRTSAWEFREAWTWSRRDGVRIWVDDPDSERGFRSVDVSRVLPGLDRDGLDGLLASRLPEDASRRSRRIAHQVAGAMLAGGAAG